MNKKFINPMPHQAKKPVSIEREENDVIVIEGVRYEGEYFRIMGAPETDVLFSIRRDENGVVKMTLVRSMEEAKEFFEEVQNAI